MHATAELSLRELNLESDLRISPRPVLAAMLLPGVALALLAWRLPEPTRGIDLALMLFVVSGLGMALSLWRDLLARWFALISQVAVILAATAWFPGAGFLSLLLLPVALAQPVISAHASPAIAGIATMGLALMARTGALAQSPIGSATTATGLWLMVAVVYASQIPVRGLLTWAWEHFGHAQQLLGESRDRQSELKRALDALAHANRQLNLANERMAALRRIAEEAQRSKAAFVGNVSHEFRTPLNIIIGLAEILMDSPNVYGHKLPPGPQRDIEILHRNSVHLSSMINDVLDLSQVEAGRLSLHKEWADLRELLEGVMEVVPPLVERKALYLKMQIDDDLPKLYCDPTRIRQVILNLVSNAARFTETGGITVQISTEGGYALVRVTDTGAGIAASDLERVFEPFQQAEPGRGQGSGLGLSISRQFVELHDGSMWLESEPGVGSTFSFRLPLQPLSGPAIPPERWISEAWVSRDTPPEVVQARLDRRVIVCDSSAELRTLFHRYDDRIEYLQASDLAEVESILSESPAQAVIINGRDSAALHEAVCEASERLPDLPVIGCAFPASSLRAVHAGAWGYLLKPIVPGDLDRALERLHGPVESILIADDDQDTLWMLRRMLSVSHPSATVWTAESGAETLEVLRRERPGCVLLDVVMPDMDGWQVLSEKGADEALSAIPTIMISAQDPQDAPLSSRLVVATLGKGLPLGRVLSCSRALARELMKPA